MVREMEREGRCRITGQHMIKSYILWKSARLVDRMSGVRGAAGVGSAGRARDNYNKAVVTCVVMVHHFDLTGRQTDTITK